MATSKETAAFIIAQLQPLPVRSRAMFGEYGIYCDEKFVALICDDTLFVKPTATSSEFLPGDTLAAPPYPGAKDHYAVPGDRLQDRMWLQGFIERTAAELPLPKKKPKKPRRSSSWGRG